MWKVTRRKSSTQCRSFSSLAMSFANASITMEWGPSCLSISRESSYSMMTLRPSFITRSQHSCTFSAFSVPFSPIHGGASSTQSFGSQLFMWLAVWLLLLALLNHGTCPQCKSYFFLNESVIFMATFHFTQGADVHRTVTHRSWQWRYQAMRCCFRWWTIQDARTGEATCRLLLHVLLLDQPR
jgi:hypothetical protein